MPASITARQTLKDTTGRTTFYSVLALTQASRFRKYSGMTAYADQTHTPPKKAHSNPLRVKNRLEEKRRSRRTPCNIDVGLASPSKHFGFLFIHRPTFQAKIKDRSARGMRVACNRHLSVGEMLQLWIIVQSDDHPKTIRLRGSVVSSGGNEDDTCHASIRLQEKPALDLRIWKDDVAASLRRMDGQ